ncbi:MAG TPA: AAA family ATPase [Rubrivivax sp.]|nr:AAA family ATPase [Rubrivivax sp.]
MPAAGLEAQARLVAALQRRLQAAPGLAAGGDGGVRCIETHISFVLLAGERAYKIKKAVDLGFVDFRALAQREFYCREELRLNRRTAPELYLDVLPVSGTPERPVLGGHAGAPAIEWALQMRAFDQDGLWERLAARGALSGVHIDALAETLAEFHGAAETVHAGSPWGSPESVRAPVRDSLRVLDGLCRGAEQRAALARLSRWEAQAHAALRASFERRRQHGRVRDVHGDLHLGNVTQFEGRTRLFDCLEFSAELRCSDVFADLAFMAMDLQAHGLDGLAHRLVNAYVERSGDAGGLRVLRYYIVYRALVRAKVAALRSAQLEDVDDAAGAAEERAAAARSRQTYLQAALRGSTPAVPVLLLTHGFSGSGKTALTQSLLELCGALRFRADVERKRLYGLDALAASDAALKPRLYSREASRATQARLRELAALALRAGWPVILDATFLDFETRQQARELAARLGVRCRIIDFRASPATLRQRVAQRRGDASEADLAVLEQQMAHASPLTADEEAQVVVFDAEAALDAAQMADRAGMAERWAPLLRWLQPSAAGAP